MKCSHCQTLAHSLTHFLSGHISDSRPLNVFMLADDERCHITINPLTRNWSALLLNSNYMAKLQARGVWTHFVAWLKTIHQAQQLSHSTYRTCIHVRSFERPFVSEHDLYLNLPERFTSYAQLKRRGHQNANICIKILTFNKRCLSSTSTDMR